MGLREQERRQGSCILRGKKSERARKSESEREKHKDTKASAGEEGTQH